MSLRADIHKYKMYFAASSMRKFCHVDIESNESLAVL